MNIACIATSRIPSDTANSIQVMKACQALAQAGQRVTLLVPGEEAHPWERLARHYGLDTPFEIQWFAALAPLRRYDFSWRSVKAARRLGADLVYSWALQAAVLSQRAGMPTLLEMHGPPEGRLGPHLFRIFLRLPGEKRLLPITRSLVEILARTYGRALAGQQIVISPNGVDLGRYAGLPAPADARRVLGLPESLTAAYTGHLYPGRGMDLLAALAGRFPKVRFLWVGGRPEDVSHWQARLSATGLANVHLTGFVPNHELPAYQAAAEILLMPYERVIAGSGGGNSAEYCSPMKMFEYLACGRAIIASDLPALREVLDESLALLPQPEAEDEWAAALANLIADPELQQRLGAGARQRARVFSWEARARKALAGFP